MKGMAKTTKQTKKRPAQRKPVSWAKFFIIVGLVMLIGTGAAWWQLVRSNPHRVFDAMIENNFKTGAVTRTVVQESGTQRLRQVTHLQNQTAHIAESRSTLEQSGQTSATVITETIGTPIADYVRYTEVNTNQKSESGKDLDFSKVLNVWGKTEVTSPESSLGELYSDSTLGVVPFADLSQPQRAKLMQLIRDNNVYAVDYNRVNRFNENGRPYYSYAVTVKPDAYITLLKAFAEETGLTQLRSLDPANYKNASELNFVIVVDVLTQRMAKLASTNGARTELYSGYGIVKPINVPTESIPVMELQQRLQSIR
ncbi:MAG: hypothetical protein JWL85_323 [Candidatus Saccharibacteria bacterium]|nr:hypothetical protein [Candidatus Saccharibacteria bacterium]